MTERMIHTDSTRDWNARLDKANAIVEALGAAWHDEAMEDILHRTMTQISPELRSGVIEALLQADREATEFLKIQDAMSGCKS